MKIPLVVVATDLANGHLKILSSGQIAPAVNASCAMPGVVRPVDLYGSRLIDGGIVAPVPVNVAKRYNPMMIIAVNIEPDFSTVLPTSSVGIFNRALDVCFHAMTKQEVANADITIHPQVGDTMLDISQKHELIRRGEVAAEKALPKIKAELKRHKIKLK